MDFDDYLTARLSTLVRAAALLGCPETGAPDLVASVVARSARHIRRAENPDPDVYRNLMSAVVAARECWPVDPALPPEGDANKTGLAVRRTLAAMDTHERDVAVLLYYGNLTLREAAEVVRVKTAIVRERAVAATRAFAPDDIEHVRDLLLDAAGTVEVEPIGLNLLPPRPRRWPWVTAAAVAVAVVALAAAAATRTTPAKPDGLLDADQVPSLFGYDAQQARALLEHLGLHVTEQLSPVCDTKGRVLDTDPPTGARFDSGDDITLITASPAGANCEAHYGERTTAWQFLDFANNRGPGPRFADAVFLVVDGGEPTVLIGEVAKDPARWGKVSALTELRAASSRVERVDETTYATPTLVTQTVVPPQQNCGVGQPFGARPRLALQLTVGVGIDAPSPCPLTVDLYLSHGKIDAVTLYTEKPAGEQRESSLSPPPWATQPRG
jgi:hypothetical protein